MIREKKTFRHIREQNRNKERERERENMNKRREGQPHFEGERWRSNISTGQGNEGGNKTDLTRKMCMCDYVSVC